MYLENGHSWIDEDLLVIHEHFDFLHCSTLSTNLQIFKSIPFNLLWILTGVTFNLTLARAAKLPAIRCILITVDAAEIEKNL